MKTPNGDEERKMLEALRRRVDGSRSKIADLSLLARRHPEEFPGGAEALRQAVAARGGEVGLKLVIRSTSGFAGLVGDPSILRLKKAVLAHIKAAGRPVDGAELAEVLTDGSPRLAGKIMALLRVRGELVRVGENAFDRPGRTFPARTERKAVEAVERILRMEGRPVQVDYLAEALEGELGRHSPRWYLSLVSRVELERRWHRSGTLLALSPPPEGGLERMVLTACRPGRSWSDVISEIRFRVRIPDSQVHNVRRLFCEARAAAAESLKASTSRSASSRGTRGRSPA